VATMHELDTLALTRTVAPTEYPVSLAEAKAHLNITVATDDPYITTLIANATERAEVKCGRQFCTATYVLRLDEWPDVILVPRPPLISVTSVKYYDTDGVQQTLTLTTDYTYDIYSEPGRIHPAYACTWPSVRAIPNAIEVTYTCGYGAAADVPINIRHAIKILVSHYYEQRDLVVTGTIVTAIPETVDRLLTPYKVGAF
jgi:uncharacterized phiE125 gp8 family phage protein